jgi:hypothetical protein
LQEIKNAVQECHLVGTFLELIHDARNDEHKKTDIVAVIFSSVCVFVLWLARQQTWSRETVQNGNQN